MSKSSLNVEWLCMDSAILLPPTGTPMTGIDFTKRLPCGEVSIHIWSIISVSKLSDVDIKKKLQLPQSYQKWN